MGDALFHLRRAEKVHGGIEAEAAHALFEPKAGDFEAFFAERGGIEVEVGHDFAVNADVSAPLFGEVPGGQFVPNGVAVKIARVLAAVEIVIARLGGGRILLRLQEPRVKMRRAVEDEVEHDPDAPLIGFRNKRFKVFHRAKSGVDRVKVGDVVFMIARRGMDGGEPQPLHAETAALSVVKIVERLDDAAQISHAVAVAVSEERDENMIVDPRSWGICLTFHGVLQISKRIFCISCSKMQKMCYNVTKNKKCVCFERFLERIYHKMFLGKMTMMAVVNI